MPPVDGKQIKAATITNTEVAVGAGIVEPKLALNFDTHSNALDHSNANDPTSDQKDALAGTGTPSSGNVYVTDDDSRLDDDRDPTAHALGGADHTSSTLAQLNTKVSDATLDDSGDPRDPNTHSHLAADLPATTVYTDQANTYTSGAQTFQVATDFEDTITLKDLDATPVSDRLVRNEDGLIRAMSTLQVEGKYISNGSVENFDNDNIANGAGIIESKLSLDFDTHAEVHSLGGSQHSDNGASLAAVNSKIVDATLIDTGDSRLSDDRDPTSHAFAGADHSASTLANVNTKISDATLIDTGDSRLSDDRDPTSHAFAGADHSASTLASVNGKISDATLIDTGDSRLSDDRDPTSHAFAGADHSASTLASVNGKISDATLIDTADARLSDDRDPTSHAFAGADHSSSTLASVNGKISDATLIDAADVGEVLIGSVTVGASVATVEFTGFVSTYEFYKLRYWCVPVTDGVNLRLRTDSSGGLSWDVGASDYRWGYYNVRTSNTPFGTNDNADTFMFLAATVGSDAGEGIGGEIFMPNLTGTGIQKMFSNVSVYERSNTIAQQVRTIGQRQATTAINGLQFSFSSGNIEAGEFRLYGSG